MSCKGLFVVLVALFAAVVGGAGLRAAEQFCHGDEFVAAALEFGNGLQCAVDCGRMDIVAQDDGTFVGAVHDLVVDVVGVAVFPVQGIDAPVDVRYADRIQYGGIEGAVRGAENGGIRAAGFSTAEWSSSSKSCIYFTVSNSGYI